jgi:cell division transport system ATP-binding protein
MSLRPTRGLIQLFGKETTSLSQEEVTSFRRRIGVVFQDFRLLDHLTTYQNVALPLFVQGKDELSFRSEVIELLRWVGLGERVDAYPPILSGGEKQRAAIARALIGQPEILIADEPTGNVDPSLARRLLRLFIELHKSGTSIIIATHDLNLMDQFSFARRLVLAEGRLQVYE